MSRSVRELLVTPATSKRKLDATYIKSRIRNIIPEYASAKVKNAAIHLSNQLEEIGLGECAWKTYRINALYDFSYNKLWHYEKILTNQIKKDISQVGSDFQNKHFVTEISHFPDVVITERDAPPIKITIVSKNEKGDCKPCFIGCLLSIERKIGFMEHVRNEAKAVILPLFLVTYTDKIFLESVKYFLEDNFSCYVGPLKFSSYDLIFMLFLFSSPGKEKCTKATIIEYKGISEKLHTIEYALHPGAVCELWQQITAPFTEEISEKEAFEFLNALEQQFYKMFSINLSNFDLQVIRTPLAVVNADHSIMVSKSHKLYYVLRHITHLAQELCQYK